jgi:hypothetical protein
LTTQQPTSSGKRLIAYFYSGWAFFIPYLLTYLLYLWQKWPANSFAPSALGNGGHIPALLHVYWVLHAIHAILALIALRIWWKNIPNGGFNPTAPSEKVRKPRFDPYLLLPWIFVALIFFIPGVYLEWPADPWEHLRRITEWSFHSIVGEHTAGYKSFYFFTYSFISVPPNLSRFGNVNVYGTCIDLLLAWQYYRLGKSVGLNQKWSFLFVLVNALTFGNVCFSFYKYYTLATTMYAQLGAVALTRITLDFVQKSKNENGDMFNLRCLPRLLTEYTVCLILLSAFVAYNHVQGIGIAGLGIGSILVWRLLDWKRSAGWWLAAAALILSIATILWWPRHPAIDSIYRPGRWLNAWYGFSLFDWRSPAAARAMQILGLFGVINLIAGFYLTWKNTAVGWLTVLPVLALSLSIIGIPLANALAGVSPDNIVAFHRIILGASAGVAVFSVREYIFRNTSFLEGRWKSLLRPFPISLVLLAGLVTLPANRWFFNRTWNTLAVTPDDLQLKFLVTGDRGIRTELFHRKPEPKIFAPRWAGYVAQVQGWDEALISYFRGDREIMPPTIPAEKVEILINALQTTAKNDTLTLVWIPLPRQSQTPVSLSGYLSGHWIPQQVALNQTGEPEIRKILNSLKKTNFMEAEVP